MVKIEKFKARLLDERSRLERRIREGRSSVVQHGAKAVPETFPNSGDDEYADAASETFDLEMDLTMLNKYRHRLEGVKAALERLDNQCYGICIRCHTQIGEARLDAIPETPYCRDCEADVEVQD